VDEVLYQKSIRFTQMMNFSVNIKGKYHKFLAEFVISRKTQISIGMKALLFHGLVSLLLSRSSTEN